MFDPTKLDGTIHGLRRDAVSLRELADELTQAVSSVVWGCPRAERFRRGFVDRRRDLLRRADELDGVADQVVALKRDVERQLRYIEAIARAVADFFDSVREAAVAAARAAQQAAEDVVGGLVKAGTSLLTGDLGGVRDGIDDVASPFGHWPWQPIAVPPPGDARWLEVDRYMRLKSGSADAHGVLYAAPEPPRGRS